MMWPFWIQNVIIGGFACRRMLTLDRFDPIGFRLVNRPVIADKRGRHSSALFFCVH